MTARSSVSPEIMNKISYFPDDSFLTGQTDRQRYFFYMPFCDFIFKMKR